MIELSYIIQTLHYLSKLFLLDLRDDLLSWSSVKHRFCWWSFTNVAFLSFFPTCLPKQYISISAKQNWTTTRKEIEIPEKIPISKFRSENCTRACHIDSIWLVFVLFLSNGYLKLKDCKPKPLVSNDQRVGTCYTLIVFKISPGLSF